jgi:hypothetical protein
MNAVRGEGGGRCAGPGRQLSCADGRIQKEANIWPETCEIVITTTVQ